MTYRIFTTSKFVCPFCVNAKNLMDKLGLDYTELDVNTDEEAKNQFQFLGLKSVPQIFKVRGDSLIYIGGYDKFKEHLGVTNDTE